ncbi:uncharacterized protein [Elaeis guineensis]|uniref:Uncharacterized protein LOC105060055 n=1 Tax=Elaeis guineensis var. tenera TaxID=51953 RepID=A0A6I9SDI0_ELAGV|nr:uncharacterized protein LOC105060055 [Elaeis guineensis]XP_029116298.1 uncharacterized protein LOC105060055 [Elaeis guineensis]
MSWLARSLVRSLSSDHGDGDGDDEERIKEKAESPSKEAEPGEDSPVEPGTPTRGVKEDLSELTKTLTRQFWGVASFLAPPPASEKPNPPSLPEMDSSASDRGRRSDSSDPAASLYADEAAAESESPRIAGIRSDFAEIGGKFRSGISMLSNTMAVSEISKIASTFLPFGAEEGEEDGREEAEEEEDNVEVGAVGVTEEVLAFARNISMHPETWLDFPLFHEDEDCDDFEMSDAQQEHALAIEHLLPRLAALRIELCPYHMSEGRFWKIYFVLLHSRLSKHDAELLSTPQIVEARAILLQDLQNRTKMGSERSGRGTLYRKEDATSVPIGEPTSDPLVDVETEKHPVQTTEVNIIDKSVIEEQLPLQSKTKDLPSETSKVSIVKDEEEGDDWLEEDVGEMGSTGGAAIPLGHEEDVSFSDLEDDDDRGTLLSSKSLDANNSQTKDSRGWVQLNKGSGGSSKSGDSTSPQSKESSDWLNVEHIDVE